MRNRKHTIEYLNYLGLEKGVSQKDLDSKYKILVKKSHPDRLPIFDPKRIQAEEATKSINEAYNYLKNSSSIFKENNITEEIVTKKRPRFKTLYQLKMQQKYGNFFAVNTNKIK